jgi:hypothetical protein
MNFKKTLIRVAIWYAVALIGSITIALCYDVKDLSELFESEQTFIFGGFLGFIVSYFKDVLVMKEDSK